MTRHLALALTTVLAVAACRDNGGDDAARNDTALARDITLATAVTSPTPELRDTPDSTRLLDVPTPEPKARPASPARRPVREQPSPPSPPPPPRTPPVAEAPEPTPSPAPPANILSAGTTV